MKANEVPEKLFLDATSKCGDNVFTIKNNDTDIEYTRTDAFIEKAWSWIENNLLSSNQQDKSRLYYKQFEKYIKGE